MATSQPAAPDQYPAKLHIDYPDKPLNRLSSFFRIFVAIPITIVLALLSSTASWNTADKMKDNGWQYGAGIGILFLPLLLMILFRQKYPKWWFDWNLAYAKFSQRVSAFILLLRDEYPSTDEDQAVHLDLIYPDVKTQLSRGMPLVKWLLAIPHLIVLAFLGIAVFFCIIVAWFAILFTGRYPRSLFDFVVGFERWCLRVGAYAFLLITDKYPPFSLD